MLCYGMLCYAMICNAKPCCALIHYAMMCSWERAHRCATGPLTRASRAGVALRASVATRPPQRWNGLPEDARVWATARLSSASRDGSLSNASRAEVALRASAAMLRCAMLWESAQLRDWSSDTRVARGGRATRLGRYATSARVERSA